VLTAAGSGLRADNVIDIRRENIQRGRLQDRGLHFLGKLLKVEIGVPAFMAPKYRETIPFLIIQTIDVDVRQYGAQPLLPIDYLADSL